MMQPARDYAGPKNGVWKIELECGHFFYAFKIGYEDGPDANPRWCDRCSREKAAKFGERYGAGPERIGDILDRVIDVDRRVIDV